MNWIKEILELDPGHLYKRVRINKFARRQNLSMGKLFPNDGKTCACGCGTTLTGRQRRWASASCQILPVRIYSVMQADLSTIYRILAVRDGEKCCSCGLTTYQLWEELRDQLDHPNRYKALLEVDHILPVYKGGGGCWIDNYQLLCYKCHKLKTKEDVKRK